MIRAQTPVRCAAIVQDMLRRISLWDRDDSILAHTPVDDDLCRRLARHSRQFINHAGGVAITNAVEATSQRTVGNHGHAIGPAVWQEIFLNRAIDEVISNLIGHDRILY